jgi:hypothetical protein
MRHRPPLRDWLLRPLAACIIALTCLGLSTRQSALAQNRAGFEYNGIVHVSWWFDEYGYPEATAARDVLAATGANWAGVLVTWYQDTATSNVVAPRVAENKTPTDASVRRAIQELHERGLKVMLKPHVDPWNGQWRGEINPTSIDAWFASYTQFIVHYAEMAESMGVEAFAVGTEFRTISGAANRQRWIGVIDAVRKVYRGSLTYAANATFPADEFTSVSFWDRLDFVGLDAYFNLTNQNNPTLDQLIGAWTSNRFGENNLAAVLNFASSRQKPVVFTEIGYKSTDRANVEPWNFGLTGPVDTAEQRDCYEAAFTVWSRQSSWMRGFFWWAWPVPPPAATDGDYTPRAKPAEAVLRSWQAVVTGPDFKISTTPTSLRLIRGATATVAVSITRAGGFTSPVALSATGVPTGLSARFDPASTTGSSSVLTLVSSRAAEPGIINIGIAGTGDGVTRAAQLPVALSTRRQQ